MVEQPFVQIAAKVSKEPIVLKIPIFDLMDDIFRRAGRLASSGDGFGQIGLLTLTCQLNAPHERPHLTT